MAESPEQITSFVLNHMKIVDLRPKEEFRIGNEVKVIDRWITGKIEKFDADHRMAWLGNGWWYLKDLQKLPLAKAQRSQRKPFESSAKIEEQGYLFENLFVQRTKRTSEMYIEEYV